MTGAASPNTPVGMPPQSLAQQLQALASSPLVRVQVPVQGVATVSPRYNLLVTANLQRVLIVAAAGHSDGGAAR